MLKVILYTIFISLTGIIAFFIYLNYLLHRSFNIYHIHCEKTPEDYGLKYTGKLIPALHGKKIELWDLNPGFPGPVIIGLHGWEIAADSLLPLAETLQEQWRILLINARNHGQSDDEKYSTIVNYAEDVESTIRYIRNNIGKTEPIALVGHSLGGAASIYTASRSSDVSAVVSISAFAEQEEVMKAAFVRGKMPSWFISSMLVYIEFRLGEKMEKLSPGYLINCFDKPVLLVHGTKDEVIHVSNMDRIAGSANRSNVEKYIMENETHSSLLSQPVLAGRINQFLKSCLK
ncbi:MAG: alpha/beta hydrolase [Calditrichaceae bacterium]|nr:alpha/beta hydrolase [Calditrichaceae bacterium]MBN2710189.1 alpha/beta hydrolase [Calditrichaceae bacterium]RQV94163.1 MAG: alpha/beta hydrolase [Calditrichota bacterium]